MLVVSLIARSLISIFAGFALGFVGWLATWLAMPLLSLGGLTLPIVGSLILGLTTSITAAAVFSDSVPAHRQKLIFAVCVIGTATIACAVTFTINISASHYIYLTRGVVFPMINFGTFTATFTAAAIYLYLELFSARRQQG